MLYRHWQPLEEGGLAIEQLVLPVTVWRTVMTVAHEIPLAGHMEGVAKTRSRSRSCYLKPGAGAGVAT